jgi:hypothetical protein
VAGEAVQRLLDGEVDERAVSEQVSAFVSWNLDLDEIWRTPLTDLHVLVDERDQGSSRLTPRLPLLRNVAVAGDFESVLSFGVALSRPAGIRVLTLTAPARVVSDLWYQPPQRLLWPATSVKQAWVLQRAVDEGHQPWLCGEVSVIESYATATFGWREPAVRRLAPKVYQVTDPASDAAAAVVTVRQPARQGLSVRDLGGDAGGPVTLSTPCLRTLNVVSPRWEVSRARRGRPVVLRGNGPCLPRSE